jgi:putative N6-adenine-specific DNA methylase
MTHPTPFEIFLITAPGLEEALCGELCDRGFVDPVPEVGGVTIKGGWPDVWRANLDVRGASRILVRIGSFRVVHLSQLDKLARRFDWSAVLRSDVPVRVEATCKRSKIYHAGAVKQRIETAILEELGAPVSTDAGVCVRARINDNVCMLSIDTSGELLHKRGHKEAVSKAPLRETMASLFLRQCGYDGSQTVLDPMCGSGTFVIEAAEIAAGLAAGRSRHFAFEQLAGFDSAAWQTMRRSSSTAGSDLRFYGSDRDAGAVRMSTANAARAGVEAVTHFEQQTVKNIQAPDGPPGLVMVNPPYGGRIGNKAQLHTLYRTLGLTLRKRFTGWRVGLVTTDLQLAQATGLPFGPAGPFVDHGGLKIRLFKTDALG